MFWKCHGVLLGDVKFTKGISIAQMQPNTMCMYYKHTITQMHIHNIYIYVSAINFGSIYRHKEKIYLKGFRTGLPKVCYFGMWII